MWPVRPVGYRSLWRLAEIQQIDGHAHTPQCVVVCVLTWHAESRGGDRLVAVRVNGVGSLVQACGDGQVGVMIPLAKESTHVLCSLWSLGRLIGRIIGDMPIMRPHDHLWMTPCGMIMNPGHIFRHKGIALYIARQALILRICVHKSGELYDDTRVLQGKDKRLWR